MADVKWIKIVTDIFDDEKILLIESLPSADSILVVWFKLLCLAGKNNNNGVFTLNDRIAYTDEMIATIFRRDLNTVRLALMTFEKYGMIEIISDVITIPNWSKYQTLDAYEKRKERDRIYQKERRKKQKLLAESTTSADDSSDVVALDIYKDVEEEREEDRTISKDVVCSTQLIQQIIGKWNSIGLTSTLTKITPRTKRHDSLRARLKQYGEGEVFRAIDEISKSKFLMGKVNNFEITFDWFVCHNNFVKIIDGNYMDKEVNRNGRGREDSRNNTKFANLIKNDEIKLTDEERRKASKELI
ncbi:MAG: phage replisome organizer N-terminal domain-containing protein [Clostridium sp.]|nr:phage replisome organizer N-terminal domain-containing protein [Clostridium sp.]